MGSLFLFKLIRGTLNEQLPFSHTQILNAFLGHQYPYPFIPISLFLSLSLYPFPLIPIPFSLTFHPYTFVPFPISLSIFHFPFIPISLSMSLYSKCFIPMYDFPLSKSQYQSHSLLFFYKYCHYCAINVPICNFLANSFSHKFHELTHSYWIKYCSNIVPILHKSCGNIV